ncbi:MAG TPA: PHB depolymerase family esterase [Labilithrix sp.]|nr:PHB depolymerase family esterase [Labilithrix sp.]
MTKNVIRLFSGLALSVMAGVYGCSSDDSLGDGPTTNANPTNEIEPSDAGAEAQADAPLGGETVDPFACPGSTITPGLNEAFDVGGNARKLYADFPKDTSKPMAVIFSWHGFGGSAENFRKAAAFDPDGDPAVPAVIITPEDTGLFPPKGLDWDIAKGTPADPNVDLAFFEAIVGCLSKQQKIDASRIYSFGFSAGSVMTNLLHSRYPKVIAAIVTESGAWMNDKAERDIVNFPGGVDWNWPELDPADRGNVLLTHGGPEDVTDFNVLDLEKSAQLALPFLKEAKRTVLDCAHTNGHKLHPDVTPAVIRQYLFAHRAGEPSPYQGGAAPGYPGSCTLRLP